jgi:hypothetical protein
MSESLQRLETAIADQRAELVNADDRLRTAEARRNEVAALIATGDAGDDDLQRARASLADARDSWETLRGSIEALEARLHAAREAERDAERMANFKRAAVHASAASAAADELQRLLVLAGEQAAIVVRESRAAANLLPQDLVEPAASSGLESFEAGLFGSPIRQLWTLMHGEVFAHGDGAVPPVPDTLHTTPDAWRANQPRLSDVYGRRRFLAAFARRGAPADALAIIEKGASEPGAATPEHAPSKQRKRQPDPQAQVTP